MAIFETTGAAAHAGGHETEVDTFEYVLERAACHLCGAFAHRGVAAGAQAARERLADEDLGVRLYHLEVLLVGVYGYRFGTLDTDVVQTVDGVVARTATADDDYVGVAEVLGVLSSLFLLLVVLQSVLYYVFHPRPSLCVCFL